jgi:peptide/nickel transport system permease protein
MTDREGRSLIRGGVVLLALLAVPLVVAPVLSGRDPNAQLDPVGGHHLPPLSQVSALELADGTTLLVTDCRRDGERLTYQRDGRAGEVTVGVVRSLGADGLPPSRRLLLGSDRFGRDLWLRLWVGGRISLVVAALASGLAILLGVAVGAGAALGGPLLDGVLMRSVDGLLAFPRLFLLLAVAALWGPGGASQGWLSLVVTALILGATGWMDLARLVRAELIALRQRDFVLAARASGCGRLRLFGRHLLPNVAPLLLADATLRLGDAILLEAALGFLGLGVQPPTASWGTLLADGREVVFQAWWMAVFPGLAVTLTVVGCGLLADGLTDRLRRR